MKIDILKWLGFWIATGALVVLPMAVCAQDSEPSTRSAFDPKTAAIISSLEKIQKDFSHHIDEEKAMQEKYRDLETKLKKTEDELQRVNVQGMQQQLAAMQSTIQSMQSNANLNLLASRNSNNSNSNNSNNNPLRDFAQMQLMQNRFLQNLDATIRANEMRQLDASAQAAVRARIETIQATVRLQQQWCEWQNKSAQFYGLYWPWSDPEDRYTAKEIEATLSVLEKRNDKDNAAKLITAQLLRRSGRNAEALSLVTEVLETQSELQGVAMMEKAEILALLDKGKESKQALQAAIKLDKSNPYLRWIRAEVAIAQDQDGIAETEFRFLSTLKSMEKEARRSLAMIHAKRSKKSPGEGTKAIKEAKAALELETIPNWYSHFVMATAYAAGRKWELATESMDTAVSLADAEQKERCETQRKEWELLKQP
jgi:hypothetical protein